MAYVKNSGGYNKKPYTGPRKGGFQKKDFDPTVVSAKDVMMARMNAITAVHTLQAAHIAAGTGVELDIAAAVERLFQDTLSGADHKRVGSAKKTAAAPVKENPAVSKAEDAVVEAFGDDDPDAEETTETVGTSDPQSAPHADMVLNSGMHAGNTLADVYEEAPEYVTDFLANPAKNKNTFTLKRAQEFVAAVA